MCRKIIPGIFFLFALFAGNFYTLSAQCTYQVTHTSGTQTINCINTTVTSSGTMDVNSVYCVATQPYFIGYSYGSGTSGNGSYTFTFSPAVSALTLNFSGTSNTAPHEEEIKLYVNGIHYQIPSVGTPNGCDPMALLTPGGNLGGCVGCGVSGWNGTTIVGPITSLTVLDTVISGVPNGSIFSLFICGGGIGGTVDLGNDTTLCSGGTLALNATTPGATYLWQDNSTNPTFTVSSPGTYWVQVTSGCGVITDSIVVNYSTPPNIQLGNDTTLCSGGTLNLNATAAGATYLWQDNSTNPTFVVSSSGTYWVEADVNGCTGSDTIVVNYGQIPLVDLGNDTTLCQGQNLNLDATTPAATYLWQDNSTNPTYTVSGPGTYWVQVTNSCGTYTDSLTINYNITFNIDLGNDTSLCQGDVLLLDGTTAGATYLWQDNSTNPTFNVNAQGTYWIEVNVNGCIDSDTIAVSYGQIPVVDLGNDTTVCQGQNLNLDATTAGVTYLWQDNSANPTFSVNTSGTYWVQLTNNCGVFTDSILINYIALVTVDLGNDTNLCQGDILLLDATTASATYLWQDNSTNPTFNVNQQGTYFVEVNVSNCSDADTIQVNFGLLPIADIGADTTLCTGEIMNLNAATPGAIAYLWHDNSTNPNFTVTQEGTYWVEITNNCGVNADSIDINYKGCNCEIFLPNTFTPNEDELNPMFFAKSNCELMSFRLTIFNRWGQEIFTSSNIGDKWNGMHKDQPVPLGVYSYHLNYQFEGELPVDNKIGQVNLIR